MDVKLFYMKPFDTVIIKVKFAENGNETAHCAEVNRLAIVHFM